MSTISRAYEIWRTDGTRELLHAAKRFYFYDLRVVRKSVKAIQSRNHYATLSYLTRGIFGKDLYMWYLQQTNENLLLINTDVGQMYVDLFDLGLSRELVIWTSREEYSNKIFKQELEILASEKKGEITILEIGANIGYFILSEVDSLDKRADIIAFEPSPKNVELLKRNVEHNAISDIVEINQNAIGASTQPVKFEVSKKYNQSRVRSENLNTDDTDISETVDVDQISINSYLNNEKISPNEIDVVRMDIQGFEAEAFKGMSKLLDSDHELLMFIETHANLLDGDEHSFVIDKLRESGFEPISSSKIPEFDTLADDRLYKESMELVIKRPKKD